MQKANGCEITPLTHIDNVLAVVLAGGKSTRMGRDKASLLLEGATLLERAVTTTRLALGVNSRIVVSGDRPGFECIPDQVAGLGPIGAINSVVKWAVDQTGFIGVLIVPVDMPLLTPASLRYLTDRGLKENVSTQFENFELPAYFRISTALCQALEQLCSPNTVPSSRSLRALLKTLAAIAAPLLNSQTEFINTNTAAQFKLAVNIRVTEKKGSR